MNRIHSDLSARQVAAPLHEPDITHEIDTVLRAMIVIMAILMMTVVTGATIESLAN